MLFLPAIGPTTPLHAGGSLLPKWRCPCLDRSCRSPRRWGGPIQLVSGGGLLPSRMPDPDDAGGGLDAERSLSSVSGLAVAGPTQTSDRRREQAGRPGRAYGELGHSRRGDQCGLRWRRNRPPSSRPGGGGMRGCRHAPPSSGSPPEWAVVAATTRHVPASVCLLLEHRLVLTKAVPPSHAAAELGGVVHPRASLRSSHRNDPIAHLGQRRPAPLRLGRGIGASLDSGRNPTGEVIVGPPLELIYFFFTDLLQLE